MQKFACLFIALMAVTAFESVSVRAQKIETRPEISPVGDWSVRLSSGKVRLGGKVISRHFSHESVPYEAGAAELYDYSRVGPDPLRELVETLGLTTRLMEGRSVFMGEHFLSFADDLASCFGPQPLAPYPSPLQRPRP